MPAILGAPASRRLFAAGTSAPTEGGCRSRTKDCRSDGPRRDRFDWIPASAGMTASGSAGILPAFAAGTSAPTGAER